MRTLRRVALSVLLATAVTDTAFAQPKAKDNKSRVDVATEVDAAEALYAKLEYEKANEAAERVIKQRNVSHDHLMRAYRILAVTSAILDKEDAARDAFLHLLVFDPDYAVDANLGPKVSTPFIEARGQFRSLPSKPGMDVVPNVRVDGGQLRVTTRDATHIAKKVTVGYRWTAGSEYTTANVEIGQATVEVSPAPPGRTRLDFYATALDERDNVIFEAGSPQAPKIVFVEVAAPPKPGPSTPATEKSRSFFKSPVFWIVTSAVAVGGGTALFFALRPQDPPTQASLSPQLRCGNELCK